MWRTLLLGTIFLYSYPAIGAKQKQSGSNGCLRTSIKRYCGKVCSKDGDCRRNQKCLCDGDCGMICVKNNLRCENLPKVKNSRSRLTNGSYFGSVVTYKCKKPYKLRGSAKRKCRATGKWDGEKTRCKTFCKDPGRIPYGSRRTERIKGVKYMLFWCLDDDMYKMVGARRIECREDGKWSAPKPKCIQSLPPCDKPNIAEGVTVIYPRTMNREFKYGDKVVLRCKDGYFKSGLGVYQCKKGNRWSGGITCSPKSCGRPNDIPNGRIIGYVYSFKEKIRYECNEGYNLKGPSYRTCQANEKWGDSDPICEVADCGPLQKPDHGDIIEQVAFTYGNRIVFDCTETGYEMKGSKVKTCQSDGTWSGSPTTCEIVQCGDPGTLQNGTQTVTKRYVYGGSVKFKCNKGYTLVGTRIIYCQANKQWSAAVPHCRASCQDPGDLLHGNKIGDNFSHGQRVSYSCNGNYVLEGARTAEQMFGRPME
ncbi:CUB and sushi domain-containing protein 3-like isoform X2 [Stylophora pistillata]|uniref:CUB and sushi domain-containing protein 3-like isoform X2 n=1 Tax=Stylophora pistillata TaxID=50429 RepID=UPI000C043250|nr:CUB and sushi domain-containing protein 3-like isoform X2 [Stylophora pistillata]